MQTSPWKQQQQTWRSRDSSDQIAFAFLIEIEEPFDILLVFRSILVVSYCSRRETNKIQPGVAIHIEWWFLDTITANAIDKKYSVLFSENHW